MITAKERERYFREALESLLERHGAELDTDYDSRRIIVSMGNKLDSEGDVVAEYTEFQL